jgi:regulator of replication initiation timing
MTNQRLMMCDSRADSFLRENSSLHLDVDKLTKIAKQKKTEADLWKSKYETQMQQIIQIKANYEQEIRSLSNETQVLIARIE